MFTNEENFGSQKTRITLNQKPRINNYIEPLQAKQTGTITTIANHAAQ